LLGCLVAGCGPSRVKAHGRLFNNGQPFVPSEKETVHVAFFPAAEASDASAKSYIAKFNREDGTFQVIGTDGQGLPPGKYRVTISVMNDRKDQFKGAFNVQNSPFLCEVSSTSSDITVDLSTPSKPAVPAQPQRRSKK
jgi:hypothetical protein